MRILSHNPAPKASGDCLACRGQVSVGTMAYGALAGERRGEPSSKASLAASPPPPRPASRQPEPASVSKFPSHRRAGFLIPAHNSLSCGSKFPFTRLKIPLVLAHNSPSCGSKIPFKRADSFVRQRRAMAFGASYRVQGNCRRGNRISLPLLSSYFQLVVLPTFAWQNCINQPYQKASQPHAHNILFSAFRRTL